MSPTRECAMCGRTFTVPANNPHRRYCTPRCRVADWRHRQQPDTDPSGGDVTNGVTTAVTPANAANAVPCCPHCGRAVAVVTLLIAPTAAHVHLPETPHA